MTPEFARTVRSSQCWLLSVDYRRKHTEDALSESEKPIAFWLRMSAMSSGNGVDLRPIYVSPPSSACWDIVQTRACSGDWRALDPTSAQKVRT